jgi:hypothetical protein
MEEVEDAAAGVRKRKRDASVAGVVVLPGEAAGLEGPGCFSWKELAEKEECEGIEEASVEEVMRWLELEISSPPGKGGGGDVDDGFVTINGNEESCGPSFSAAASTVMASVDTRLGAPPPPTPIPWPWPEPDSSTNDDDGTKAMTSAANELLDEQWLLDLLTAGGPALEVFSGLELE